MKHSGLAVTLFCKLKRYAVKVFLCVSLGEPKSPEEIVGVYLKRIITFPKAKLVSV